MNIQLGLLGAAVAITGATLLSTEEATAGFRYPYGGSGKYCEARSFGMSSREAYSLAVQQASSDRTRTGSSEDRFNRSKMASLIKRKCGETVTF